MRKLKEMLRLHFELGLSNRAIARNLSTSHTTVSELLGRFQALRLPWPLPADLDEAALEAQLYPGNTGKSRQRPEPDWLEVHRELRQDKHVTLQLLWLEYKSAQPHGYQSLWSAVETVQLGLGGGNEIAGGLWVLLVDWAALRSGKLPKALNYLGVGAGVVGLLTAIPVLEVLGGRRSPGARIRAGPHGVVRMAGDLHVAHQPGRGGCEIGNLASCSGMLTSKTTNSRSNCSAIDSKS